MHREPIDVPEYWKEIRNPIRRFYTAPLDVVTKVLTPVIGFKPAYAVRFFTGKFLMATFFLYAATYYMKYNQGVSILRSNRWTKVQVAVITFFCFVLL